MTTHTIPSDVFDRLAGGDGDTLGALRAGQRSKRLLLLHEVVSTARSRAPQAFAEANTEQALSVLVDAQRRSPSVVDDLLLQPHIGAWGMHCLGTLLSDNQISPADIGHLGAVAACAALRAGQAFEVTAYLRDGAVMFPSFGMARLGTMRGWCRIRSRPESNGVEISAGDTSVNMSFDEAAQPGGTWLLLRRLRSVAQGVEVNVHIDDLDPYRRCGRLPASDRLDQGVVDDWQAKLDEAWALLVQDHPVQAEAIANGVVSFVPLVPSPEKPELSATCHQAIGAMAMTPPHNAVSLALALVHEFQHTKLSALLDLVPLFDRAPQELFYAPWRRDPRPLRGLLQGAYAYLGLTEFWEEHRRRQPLDDEEGENVAHFEFALWRDQVARTLDVIRRSGRLTSPGQRCLDHMERSSSRFLGLPVPDLPRSLARTACLDHATSWRLRNLVPDPEHVADWADAWVAGKAFPAHGEAPTSVVDSGGPIPSDGRIALFRHRLSLSTDDHEYIHGANAADLLLVEGRLAEAADTYRDQISRSPDDLTAWSGLALVHTLEPTPGTRALATGPELVRALHQAILHRTGDAPDPEGLASWLSRGGLSAET